MKPLPLLALVCALVTPALAGGGPSGPAAKAAKDAAYMKGPWDAMFVVDPSGNQIELWVNLQDAGKTKWTFWNGDVWDGYKDSGTAPLFQFTRQTSNPPYINYTSAPTDYVLVISGGHGKVTKTGAPNWSAEPSPESFFQAQGTQVVVTRGGAAPPAPLPATPASGLLEVVPGVKDAADKTALLSACAKGKVVVKGADIGTEALATSSPTLYCGNKDAGNNPVLVAIGSHKLTTTSQFGHLIVRLDNGPYNAGDPDSQIKLVPIAASALPAAGGATPTPTPNHPPKPDPNNPPQPPTPGQNGVAAIALTAHEKNWLALDEFISYRTQHAKIEGAKPVPKDKHTQLVKLYSTFRDAIQKNVPPASTSDYSAERTKGPASKTPAGISAYIKELDGKAAGYKYLDADINLSTTEQATAKKAASASGDASKTLLDDYTAERTKDAQTVASGETADKGVPHDDAGTAALRTNILYFRTTTKFRALLGGGTPANPTTPTAAPWPPLDARFHNNDRYLSDSEWATYQQKDSDLRAQYAHMATNSASASDLAAIIKQINDNEKTALGVLAHDIQKKKVDLATINSEAMTWLNPDQRSYMCDAIVKAEALAGSAAPAAEINNGGSAVTGLESSAGTGAVIDPSKARQVQARDQATRTGKAAPAPAPTPAPTVDPSKITTNSFIYQACGGSATPPPGGGGQVAGGGTTDLNGTIPPPPDGVAPGTESDKAPAPADKNVMTHVRSGLGGALVGLIFGTFFGPVGVLVGAAIGFGLGYATDKYLVTGSS